jgi:Cu-processing system permease protein
LLSQPVNRAEVFFGKALGSAFATVGALVVGFGLAGVALSFSGDSNPIAFLIVAGFSALLALASLGLGFVISAFSRKTATALGAALIVWLVLVFFSDLGVVGVTLSLRPTPASLFSMLVLNPLQVFKLGAIYSLRSTLDTLGAVGQYAALRFGEALPWLLAGLLGAWIAATFGAAFSIFARRGDV